MNKIEEQQNQLLMLLHESQKQDTGLVSADNNRKLVTKVGDRLVVDFDRIDVFSQSTAIQNLPPWKPKSSLKAYSKVSKIYLDIETTGGVKAPYASGCLLGFMALGISHFKSLSRISFFYLLWAIEYTQLISIGLRDETGKNIILSRDQYSEYDMLKYFLNILIKKKPQLLFTFNGMHFDLPFLIGKLNGYLIDHPFWISNHISTFRTAQLFGKPTHFNGVHIKVFGQKIHHIDLYHQVLAFDFVARSLTRYNLKDVPLEMKLRENPRLDLGYEGILEAWRSGDLTKLNEYLIYDLEDTELIADALMPSVYYQLLFFDEFPFQSLATMGNGTKWNSLLKNHYGHEPEAYEPRKFIGGKTDAKAGLWRNVSKFDVASLYPSIMFNYGITSDKDVDKIVLRVIKYGRTVRLGFKTLKLFVAGAFEGSAADYLNRYDYAIDTCFEFCLLVGYEKSLISNFRSLLANGDIDGFKAEIKKLGKGFFNNEGSIKVVLNSAYGFLNTTGIPFNDPVAASLVTAYGRKILKFMHDFVVAEGASIVNLDTDAVAISTHSLEENDRIFAALQKALPSWIEIEHELRTPAFYVPPIDKMEDFEKNYKFAFAKKKGAKSYAEKFFYKVFENELPSEVEAAWYYTMAVYQNQRVSFNTMYEIARKFNFSLLGDGGLRKNYIMFLPGGKIKFKGRFTKRDRSVFEKRWQSKYLELYLSSPDTAEAFYQHTKNEICNGSYPLEELQLHRTIRKGETTLVQAGIGRVGQNVALYQGIDGINQGEYDRVHYLAELKSMYDEIQTAFIIQNEAKK